MEVEAMEEGEINDEAVEEVVMEDVDYAELKNKFVKPKKRVAGETPRIVIRRGTGGTISTV
jgi:hypothetical protein